MLKDLVKIANKLDSLGLTKEADLADRILQKLARESNQIYLLFAQYILNSLKNYQENYTVTQDYNYGGYSLIKDMAFYIIMHPNEIMKSEEEYKKIFPDNSFFTYELFRIALDSLTILFVDASSTPDGRTADMGDDGIMRIFIKNLDDKFNAGSVGNLVEEFFKTNYGVEIATHELTHYLNAIRSRVEATYRSKGNGDKYKVNTPEYIDNTEEIQARIIEVLGDPNLEHYTEVQEALKNNDPKRYINFLAQKIYYWGKYSKSSEARIINRLYDDFQKRKRSYDAKPSPVSEPVEAL